MDYPGAGCTVVVATEGQLREFIDQSVRKAVADAFETRTADLEMRREWLSNREVMAEFGWSRSTLARMRKSGKLPYSKGGSLIHYRRADVEAMLEAGMRRG